MSVVQQQPSKEDTCGSSKLVLRRVGIRSSFMAGHAPVGVAEFIRSTPYAYKLHLQSTMSGKFDSQIPGQRPEWWIVQKDGDIIKGVALVSYSRLNGEGRQEFVGIEHVLVAEDYRNKGVGTLILRTLQKLARKCDDLAGVNLESEHELLSYYARFGFVRRQYQPPGKFVKLVWRP
jgi:GNAT superfamily N-acetyltransferase